MHMNNKNKKIIVLQHAAEEHLGHFDEVLRGMSVDYTCLRADLGEEVPLTLEGFDGIIALGGPQSVLEVDKHSFIESETELMYDALAKNRPVWGVCLGSQILASALGAKTYASSAFEIGWKTVRMSEEIKSDRVFAGFPRTITPLHWHGDAYDLPHGAVPIGSSDLTHIQGFAWRERCYGLMFHIEICVSQVASMAAAFPDDLARGGVSEITLLAEAERRIEELRGFAAGALERWIKLL